MELLYPELGTEQDLMMRTWGINLENIKAAQVDHIPLSQMTHAKFRQEYVIPRKPVVIEGAYNSCPLSDETGEWSFQNIRDKYGHVELPSYMIPLQRGYNRNCTLTGLCKKLGLGMTLGHMLEETFLLSLKERKQRIHNNIPTPYPHDLNLEFLLPQMFREFKTLSYFAQNIRTATLPTKKVDKWPSLFLGTAGTTTGLHVDGMGTSFTMAVLQGKKQFVLFHPSDAKYLCAGKPLMGSHYGIDAFQPDFQRCPDALQTSPLFASVSSGDILYVPGSTLHAARNVEDGIGISQNFHTPHDYVSHMESGPMGYQEYMTRILQENQHQGTALKRDFLAYRDLFLLLQETGYQSDWSHEPLFLDTKETRTLSFEKLERHLLKVLQRSPQKYAIRIAFLCNNRLGVHALQAAQVWECLEENDREMALVQPHSMNSDDTISRIRATFNRSSTMKSKECQDVITHYWTAIEQGMSQAAQQVQHETTFSSLPLPSSWPKSRQ